MKEYCQWQKYVVKCGGIFLFFEEISLFVDIQNLLKKRKNRCQKEKILHV